MMVLSPAGLLPSVKPLVPFTPTQGFLCLISTVFTVLHPYC